MKQKSTIEYRRALIYCRVSSEKQVNEGHGLDSQEQRCIGKAKELNLDVAQIFRDEGVSGGLLDRPAMLNLIQYMDDHSDELFVVIFDDLKRFARQTEVHLSLKSELAIKRKARLECLNFKFEDTPTGKFIETVMAAGAQLEREQNREQVMNKMKARLEAGYWTFCPPPGLKNESDSTWGRILKPVDPYASIYKNAIEQFRDYQLPTMESVKIFIQNQYFQNGIQKSISLSGVKRILTELLYTGYLEYPKWGIERMQGKHQGFIDYETYLSVQNILNGKAKPRLRKDYNEDFPVRGYAMCSDCLKPMTAAWFTGRGGRYPKYLCKTSNCAKKNKGVSKNDLENSLTKLLKEMTPNDTTLDFVKVIIKDVWKDRIKREQREKDVLIIQMRDLENKNSSLMDRIVQTNNESVVHAYETAMTENLALVSNLRTQISTLKYTDSNFQTTLDNVLDFIKSPIKQWENGDCNKKRLLLQMYFDKKLVYDPLNGFQTLELPLILELSKQKMTPKGHLVDTLSKNFKPIYEWIMNSYVLIKSFEELDFTVESASSQVT